MIRRAIAIAALAALALVPASAAAAKTQVGEEDKTVHATAEDSAVNLNASQAFAVEQAWIKAATSEAIRLREYMRAVKCGSSSVGTSTPANNDCSHDVDPTQAADCGGPTPLMPLWRRDRATPTSAWGPWRLAADWSCPQEALPAFTAEDFRRLPLAPAQVTVQPAASTVLVNIPTITMAAAPQQNLTTDLLGYPVEVQATATSYTWDYGDGSAPLVTTSPGHAYPNHDVHHSYARPGTFTITLTTTWSGQYRIAGSTAWLPVDGTATTVTTIPPITAVEQRTALVAEPCTPSTC